MVMVQYFDKSGLKGTRVYNCNYTGFAWHDARWAVEHADFNAKCAGFGAAVITSSGHQFVSSDSNDKRFLDFWA